MREIMMYETRDGQRFDSRSAATLHEDLVSAVDCAYAFLRPRPTNGDFESGKAYLQQDPEAVRSFKRALLGILGTMWPGSKHVAAALADPDNCSPHGILGRIISDSDERGVINQAWDRLQMIDEQAREWHQIYYALHPGPGAKQI